MLEQDSTPLVMDEKKLGIRGWSPFELLVDGSRAGWVQSDAVVLLDPDVATRAKGEFFCLSSQLFGFLTVHVGSRVGGLVSVAGTRKSHHFTSFVSVRS